MVGQGLSCEALKIVSAPGTDSRARHSVLFFNVHGRTSKFSASTQDIFDHASSAPLLTCSFSQVVQDSAHAPSDWTTVSHKAKPKATVQGTKINTVIAAVPDNFRVPYPLLGINGPEFMEHIHDTLRTHPGALALLANNAFTKAIWSNNRKCIKVSYQFPLDQQLKLATHTVLAAFLGAPISDTRFIEHPMVSSIKWLAVPHLDTNGQVVSEEALWL